MLAITMKLEHIGHWIKMRQFLARFSASVSSVHAPSWADFIIATPAFELSVHTRPYQWGWFIDLCDRSSPGGKCVLTVALWSLPNDVILRPRTGRESDLGID